MKDLTARSSRFWVALICCALVVAGLASAPWWIARRALARQTQAPSPARTIREAPLPATASPRVSEIESPRDAPVDQKPGALYAIPLAPPADLADLEPALTPRSVAEPAASPAQPLDPEQEAEAFVTRTKNEVAQRIAALDKEANELRARLAKVEAASNRLKNAMGHLVTPPPAQQGKGKPEESSPNKLDVDPIQGDLKVGQPPALPDQAPPPGLPLPKESTPPPPDLPTPTGGVPKAE